MASPQKENGYTQIATEVLEALARKQVALSDHEWKILMFLFRKTYGWNKKADTISISQFAEGTGSQRPHASRAIQKLLKKNIITSTQIGTSQDKKYAFQKDHEKWGVVPKQVPVKPVPKQVPEPVPVQDATSTKIVQKPVPKQVPTIYTTKDTNKKQLKTAENEANLENILATMESDIKNFRALGNSEEWIKKIYLGLGVSEFQVDKALSKKY